MELFALVAAYVLMRVTGGLGPLGTGDGLIVGTGSDGRGRRVGGGSGGSTGGAGGGSGGSAGGGWRTWLPTGWRPGADRVAAWWSGLTDRWRDRAHTELDRAEWDRDQSRTLHPNQPDPRGWRTRYRHRRTTCPECGHGGLVPPRPSCDCATCSCQYVHSPPQNPAGDPITSSGGDLVSAPTPAPAPAANGVPAASPRPAAPSPAIPPPAWNGAPGGAPRPAPNTQGGGVAAAEFNAQDLEAMIVRHARELQFAHDHMAAGSMPAAITTGLSELNDRTGAYKTVVVRYTAAIREAARNAGGVGQMGIYVDR